MTLPFVLDAVIFFVLSTALFAGTPTTQPATQPTTLPTEPIVARLNTNLLPETSGIIASRKYPGVYWSHNDSGNAAVLFAIDETGTVLSQFPVRAANRDWEDIAIDDAGHLFIGEIGNNRGRYTQLAVYQVDEPDPRAAEPHEALKITRSWALRFPENKPFDCESLFIYRDAGYIISKRWDGVATIYRFDLVEQQKPAILAPIANLSVPAPVTAADISADGKQLAIMTLVGPYLYKIDGEVSAAEKVTPTHVRYIDPEIEAVAFIPKGLIATSELGWIVIFPINLFDPPATQPSP